MSLIDKSYFVLELDIARTNNADVAARLNGFIEIREAELLEKLLGVELYASFTDGISQDPVASHWNNLLFGTTYYNGRCRWKGLLNFNGGVSASLKAAGDLSVVVGRGEEYDPLPDQAATVIPEGFVGRPFSFVQRGFGEFRKDEYSVEGDILTLLGGVKFSGGDTFFYKAPYSVSIEAAAGTRKQSLIANYVYWWWHRDHVSTSSGTGESQPAVENATAVSPNRKMCRAWNEMSGWVKELVRYLDYSQDVYPEWQTYTGYCALREFAPINIFGI